MRPGELVDDLDLAVDDEVLDAVVVQRLGAQRLDQVVDHLARAGRVEVLDAERLLDLGDARLGRRGGLALLVDLVVLAEREALDDLRERVVDVGRLLGLAGDDQRRARLVDEDRVDLVHDRERVRALHRLLELDREVVAQVVEAELGVRAVGDVAGVGGLAGLRLHLGLDHADGHAERLVDRAHPLGVAAREVVVDRDEVRALADQRVEVERQRGHQRLALAGLHLGDRALVEHGAADELNVEVAHAERALGGLAHAGEGLGEQIVELLALGETLAELGGLGAQRLVVELLDRRLPRGRLLGDELEATQQASFAGAEQLVEKVDHGLYVMVMRRPQTGGGSVGAPT